MNVPLPKTSLQVAIENCRAEIKKRILRNIPSRKVGLAIVSEIDELIELVESDILEQSGMDIVAVARENL